MQLVDRSACASKKGVTVWGRNNALRTSVKKPRADSMLKVGNHLRDRRRRYTELGGRSTHAAGLDHGEEHKQVAQPQTAANFLIPLNAFRYKAFS